MYKVLIIEDEEMLANIIRDNLLTQKFDVEVASDGEEGLKKFHEYKPHIIILDIMMPRLNGYEVAQQIRKENETIPFIFLSAKSQTEDIVKGFELGANDYLRKPFQMEELVVRVSSLLKFNHTKEVSDEYVIGNYLFNFSKQSISIDSHKTEITFKESQVLKYLAENLNDVVSKEIVLSDIWGLVNEYTSRNMDVVITKLRTYFKKDERIKIINLRGVGYKLIVD